MVDGGSDKRNSFDYFTKILYCSFKRFPFDYGYAFNKVLLNNIISILVALPKILRDTNQPFFQVC